MTRSHSPPEWRSPALTPSLLASDPENKQNGQIGMKGEAQWGQGEADQMLNKEEGAASATHETRAGLLCR